MLLDYSGGFPLYVIDQRRHEIYQSYLNRLFKLIFYFLMASRQGGQVPPSGQFTDWHKDVMVMEFAA